jgi:uncharacterized protein YndB with AHSA1/START domain
MIEVTRTISAPPQAVFALLADGWFFATWVVGTSHIRSVDSSWPAAGSKIHHSVGPWPLAVSDSTTVVSVEPDSAMELEARLWPIGAALVQLRLEPRDDGTTLVRIAEKVVHGPGSLLPSPVQRAFLVPRNNESLRRLADLVEGRRTV